MPHTQPPLTETVQCRWQQKAGRPTCTVPPPPRWPRSERPRARETNHPLTRSRHGHALRLYEGHGPQKNKVRGVTVPTMNGSSRTRLVATPERVLPRLPHLLNATLPVAARRSRIAAHSDKRKLHANHSLRRIKTLPTQGTESGYGLSVPVFVSPTDF